MPSLKDLKIRIASVKSTRKITKAMQMVAAAKLRRAQEAAEAARPYAERMEAVLGNLAAGVAGSPSAPRLLAGTGKSDVHLLVVATSERGLCGGFNSSIVKLARAHVARLLAEGKTVQDPDRRQEGPRAAAPRPRPARWSVTSISAWSSASATSTRPAIADEVLDPLRGRRVRRLHAVLQPLPVGHQPDPDRPPADPGGRSRRAPTRSRSTNTSPTRRPSSPICCRAASRRRCSRRCSRTAPPNRARG